MPLGLSEPLFVPGYWNPPSLFNLAQKTGFDIESILFSFAIGGIGSVLYRIFIPAPEMMQRMMSDMMETAKSDRSMMSLMCKTMMGNQQMMEMMQKMKGEIRT